MCRFLLFELSDHFLCRQTERTMCVSRETERGEKRELLRHSDTSAEDTRTAGVGKKNKKMEQKDTGS